MRQPYLISDTNKTVLPDWLGRTDLTDLESLEHEKVSFFLVESSQTVEAYKILEQIRQHSLPLVYLKPVALVITQHDVSPDIEKAFDASILQAAVTEQSLNELAGRLEKINRWRDSLGQMGNTMDRNIVVKLLRYIASRHHALLPVSTVRSRSGFVYPELEPFLNTTDEGVFQTLEFLEQQNLISGEFKTKARFCNHCHSAFLNFKEVCVHCGSEDLKMDELIHHFKCGYTAEMADFQREDELVCPKCDRTLRHIGVDYDKPSIMYRCNSCTHAFQEPDVMTSCFSCGRSTEPENQLFKTIKNYTITAIGESAARHGLENLFGSIVENEIPLTSYQQFTQFINIEAARIERYKISTSSLILINFKGLDSLYVRLGARAGSMFRELSSIIESILRTSDVVTARDESIFIIALTETSLQQTERAIERLREGFDDLLKENFDTSLQLITESVAIDQSLNLADLLEAFLQKHAD